MIKKSFNLITLITITALVFISSVIWKFSQTDNSEVITPITKEIVKIKPTKTVEVTVDEIKLQETELKEHLSNPEVREKIRASSAFHMKLASLQTEEKLLDAYYMYNDAGDDIKADLVLKKLYAVIPNFELPN